MSDIFQTDRRQDKFGFYQVGDLKFYSKFEALEHVARSGQKVTWNFNDEVYNTYNWTVEPKQSISELYRARAQQLRDQYDYLVLWFSGGADSSNILNSFIENDIKIDELASWTNYEATGDKFNVLNGEIYNQATLLAEEAKIKQPHLKHRVLDVAKLSVDFYSSSSSLDWMYWMNAHFSPNNGARRDIKLSVPEWVDMFDKGKKVAFISGIDKPAVTNLNNDYYFKFIDVFVDTGAAAYHQQQNRPWEFNELFYWTPDLPEIVIKQSHLIKQYCKTVLKDLDEFNVNEAVSNTVVTIKGKWFRMPDSLLNKIIYPGWKPNPWQRKGRYCLESDRDTWFFNLNSTSPTRYFWNASATKFRESIPESYRKVVNNVHDGIKHLNSQYYCIGS